MCFLHPRILHPLLSFYLQRSLTGGSWLGPACRAQADSPSVFTGVLSLFKCSVIPCVCIQLLNTVALFHWFHLLLVFLPLFPAFLPSFGWSSFYYFIVSLLLPDKSLFLKKFILFIFGDKEGKEKEKERHIHVWLPLARPLPGTRSSTQACALTGK